MKDETIRRNKEKCYLCDSMNSTLIAKVDKKPERENDFGILPENYLRFVYKCGNCAVYFNPHDIENMAEKIESIYKPGFNREMYLENRVKLIEDYSWDKTAGNCWIYLVNLDHDIILVFIF